MSLERVFVICMNGSFCFVLSLLTALSFPSFFPVLSLLAASSFLFLPLRPFSSCLSILSRPALLLRLLPSKTKTLNVITLKRYQKSKT